MNLFITNFLLLDHSVETLENESEKHWNLLIFTKNLSVNEEEEIQIKLKRLWFVDEFLIVETRQIFKSFILIYNLFKKKYNNIIWNDFSGFHVLWILFNLNKKQSLILHDVIPHKGEETLFWKFKDLFYSFFSEIILTSEKSFLDFNHLHRRYKGTVSIRPLPVYNYLNYGILPTIENIPDSFILLFGRVSPYKGFKEFLSLIKDLDVNVILAGKGGLYINLDNCSLNFFHFNRYVNTPELNFLILKSKLIVVPYLEATQSGVLSVLKGFDNKIILVRDIPAFNEYKMESKFIFYDDLRLIELINDLYFEKKLNF